MRQFTWGQERSKPICMQPGHGFSTDIHTTTWGGSHSFPPFSPPLLHITPHDWPPRLSRTEWGTCFTMFRSFSMNWHAQLLTSCPAFTDPSHAHLVSPQSFLNTVSGSNDHLTLPSGALGTICDNKLPYCNPTHQAVSCLPPQLGQCFWWGGVEWTCWA